MNNNLDAEKTNRNPTNDSAKSELTRAEVQLELERLENRLSKQIDEHKNNVANQDKVLGGFKDRLDDYKWFFIFLAGLLTGGNFLYIRNSIDSTIKEQLKAPTEEIKLAIAEIKKSKNQAKECTEDIKKLAKEAKEIRNTVNPKDVTQEQKKTVMEDATERNKKPEEEYTAEDYFAFGYKAVMDGKFEEAIINCDKAIVIKPDYTKAWNIKGIALAKSRRFKEAITAYDNAIAIKPDADVWYNKGIALDGLERFKEAITAYDNAIAIKPDADVYYYNLACTYSRKKDGDLALKYLEIAIDKGFNDLKLIKKDPALAFINKTAEYGRIIAKLKAKK